MFDKINELKREDVENYLKKNIFNIFKNAKDLKIDWDSDEDNFVISFNDGKQDNNWRINKKLAYGMITGETMLIDTPTDTDGIKSYLVISDKKLYSLREKDGKWVNTIVLPKDMKIVEEDAPQEIVDFVLQNRS